MDLQGVLRYRSRGLAQHAVELLERLFSCFAALGEVLRDEGFEEVDQLEGERPGCVVLVFVFGLGGEAAEQRVHVRADLSEQELEVAWRTERGALEDRLQVFQLRLARQAPKLRELHAHRVVAPKHQSDLRAVFDFGEALLELCLVDEARNVFERRCAVHTEDDAATNSHRHALAVLATLVRP